MNLAEYSAVMLKRPDKLPNLDCSPQNWWLISFLHGICAQKHLKISSKIYDILHIPQPYCNCILQKLSLTYFHKILNIFHWIWKEFSLIISTDSVWAADSHSSKSIQSSINWDLSGLWKLASTYYNCARTIASFLKQLLVNIIQ